MRGTRDALHASPSLRADVVHHHHAHRARGARAAAGERYPPRERRAHSKGSEGAVPNGNFQTERAAAGSSPTRTRLGVTASGTTARRAMTGTITARAERDAHIAHIAHIAPARR